jgi:hypothetical protein
MALFWRWRNVGGNVACGGCWSRAGHVRRRQRDEFGELVGRCSQDVKCCGVVAVKAVSLLDVANRAGEHGIAKLWWRHGDFCCGGQSRVKSMQREQGSYSRTTHVGVLRKTCLQAASQAALRHVCCLVCVACVCLTKLQQLPADD